MKMLLVASMVMFALASQAKMKYDENLNSEYLKRSENTVDNRLLSAAMSHLISEKGALNIEGYQVRQPNTVFFRLTTNEICKVFVSSIEKKNDYAVIDCK